MVVPRGRNIAATYNAPMSRITVLGGTGYAGGNVVAEAQRRGHEVTGVSRSRPEMPAEGVSYVTGSVLDPDFLSSTVTGADVVFDALSPRGDLAGRLEQIVDELIRLLRSTPTRLGVLGGASSLLMSEGGPRFFDANPPAEEVRPEIETGLHTLEALRISPEDLDWFYVSPAAGFGGWAPGEATGSYRISDDVLLVDEKGDSFISGADLALAVLDEIEEPRHRRRRFHVAY